MQAIARYGPVNGSRRWMPLLYRSQQYTAPASRQTEGNHKRRLWISASAQVRRPSPCTADADKTVMMTALADQQLVVVCWRVK